MQPYLVVVRLLLLVLRRLLRPDSLHRSNSLRNPGNFLVQPLHSHRQHLRLRLVLIYHGLGVVQAGLSLVPLLVLLPQLLVAPFFLALPALLSLL